MHRSPWRRDLRGLFPDPATGYRGTRFSLWLLVALTAVTAVRSLVHVFAPDGGAGSIAGLDVEVEGGTNLIALFAQWGWAQALLALVGIVALTRYRFLIPFAWLLQVLDWGGRSLVGQLKPLVIDAPPPGALGNAVFLPLALAALWFALPRVGASVDEARDPLRSPNEPPPPGPSTPRPPGGASSGR
ncbi:MAG: hypothetical protein ABR510_09910 [Trueperaceae bacterium]